MTFARLSWLYAPQSLTHSKQRIQVDHIHQLLESYGFIRHSAGAGFYSLLPLGFRVLSKLTRLVEKHMAGPELSAQRVAMPTLVPSALWKTTGRLELCVSELLKLVDRHGRELILNPTHEESVTYLMSHGEVPSHRQFPLRLYQITSKFRDEMKPRFGLMRAREFTMKDLYSFDVDVPSAMATYECVRSVYRRFFKDLGVNFAEVIGDSGTIGGAFSHEFHIVADVGEDELRLCRQCNLGINVAVGQDTGSIQKCYSPDGRHDWESRKGIEVGHTFYLGDRYSKPLRANFRNPDGKLVDLQMGCYGLGVSRLVAAILEGATKPADASTDDLFLHWPVRVAPYSVMLIPPKAGSRESGAGVSELVEFVGRSLVSDGIFEADDVIVDDRTSMTIGKRLLNAKRIGIPFVVIGGRSSAEPLPKYEVWVRAENNSVLLTALETKDFLRKAVASLRDPNGGSESRW